jgi:hypothetical protein
MVSRNGQLVNDMELMTSDGRRQCQACRSSQGGRLVFSPFRDVKADK